MVCLGGGIPPPPEENADLLYFTPEHAHLLLQGFYGDLLHHNNWFHLYGGGRKRRYLVASLAPASRAIDQMVCHTLRSSGALFHGNIGSVMAGSSQQELEL